MPQNNNLITSLSQATVVATGTTQATAAQATAMLTTVATSSAANSGIKINPLVGQVTYIYNASAVSILAYPPIGVTLAQGASYSLTAGTMVGFIVLGKAASVASGAASSAAGLLPLLTAVVNQLPTTLPGASGVLWNNGGIVSVS